MIYISSYHIFHTVYELWPGHRLLIMELSHGQIIQKPKKQELSSLFMTPVKFHKYIQYGLGVMARTRLLYGIKSRADNSERKRCLLCSRHIVPMPCMHLKKFHKYIPYCLGVMARTRFTKWTLSQGQIIKTKKCKSCLPCS